MTTQILLTISILSAGLIGGLLFGWMVSVIPGLKGVGDSTYISTMQSINVRIVNPAFVIPFMLTPALLAGAGVLEFRAGNGRRGWLLGTAAVTYFIGVLAVTIGGNIPLNDALDEFDLGAASVTQTAERRSSYERPWNRWHMVRTLASGVAFALATSSAIASEVE
jgi:uncharacterized membrane protein